MREIFSVLPAGSTISVTCADHLSQELFTHRGAGTLLVKGEKVFQITSLSDPRVDEARLSKLLEEAFRVLDE